MVVEAEDVPVRQVEDDKSTSSSKIGFRLGVFP